MRVALLMLWGVAYAQIPTVSFSPQGAELLRQTTGKTIKGFQLVGVMVCSPSQMTYSGGQVYAAAASAGYAWIGQEATGTVLTRTADHSWAGRLATWGQYGTSAALTLTSSGIVSASPGVITALAYGHGISDSLFALIKFRAPTPTTLLGLLAGPQSTYTLAAGGCMEHLIGAKFPGPGPVLVPLPGHSEGNP